MQNRFLRTLKKKWPEYLLEIIVLVIGIYGAFAVDNWNEQRKDRKQEIKILKSLKSDLSIEFTNNNNFKKLREEKAKACAFLLFDSIPKSRNEIVNYINQYSTVLFWRTYVPNNNTFKELVSSGNLSLISNDSIRYYLQELDNKYKAISNGEEHMRHEYDEYIYNIIFPNTNAMRVFDLKKIAQTGIIKQSDSTNISDAQLVGALEEIKWISNNLTLTNAFKITMLNNMSITTMHGKIHDNLLKIDELIESELSLK